jgi:hypothetical protein
MTVPVSAPGRLFRSIQCALLAFACGGAPPPEEARKERTRPAEASPEDSARWGLIELDELPGVIALYDPGGWKGARGGSFVVLEHERTRSSLSIRVSRAARLVRPSDCEAEARLLRPSLPRADPDVIVEERPLDAPRDFSGTLVLGVEPRAHSALRGFALAVGAAVGRCYVLSYETIADGPDAASLVADRLRAAAERLVPSVRLYGVDQRVHPERELK